MLNGYISKMLLVEVAIKPSKPSKHILRKQRRATSRNLP